MRYIKLIIISFILFISGIVNSQPGWFRLNSGITSNLNGIDSYDIYAFAVGNNGVIIRTTNAGVDWFTQLSGTTNNLNSVTFRPWQYGYYIVGASGTILKTTNFGGSWFALNSGTNAALNAVWPLYDSLTVFAVGDGGTILKSTNQGATWSVKPCPVTNNLNGIISAFPMDLFIVSDNGKILHSFDLGESWFQQTTGTSNNLNSLTVINDFSYTAIVIAVGDNGTILKTTNSGLNWTNCASATNHNLSSVSGSVSVNGIVVYFIAAGSNGTVIESIGGDIWQNRNISISDNLNCIQMQNINTGFAVGNNGTIIKSIGNYYYISSRKLDANSISTWFGNDGEFNYNKDSVSSGFEWPKSSEKYARYASALWIGALVNTDTLLATAQYQGPEYFPGYTDNNGIPHGRTDSNYRIYKLNFGTSDPDRQFWPNSLLGNSDQGAPVYFDTSYNSWKPLDFGSQTMFYSFTDSYPESHINYNTGQTTPLKADVKQLNFSLDVGGALGNVAFSQFTIINRSNNTWNNTYFTIWSDDDLGDGWDDKVGCDSALSLGYTYNAENYDPIYGSAPPAVGFMLLKGAYAFTGNTNDTVRYCKNKNQALLIRYKDLGMKVFNFSMNHPFYHDPYNYSESYRLMKGLFTDGSEIIHPYGYTTTLVYSGDPVTNTGWNALFVSDYRMYVSTGPINMNPGDTQVIVTAQIIARGTSNLNSISVLRSYVNEVRQFYNSCYTSVQIGIINQSGTVKRFNLSQNYPNPFNPITKIKFDLPNSLGKKGVLVRLSIYDILGRELIVLVNQELKEGSYEVSFDGTNFASGVYFYQIKAGDFIKTRKMLLIK